ncbi:non-canonical purine NTP pyrophosphatase [Saccharobesus litoralis]|uniref:dITP/XTP pyrophosphatase n=1 Tax=Saccharobesus litoralis TaxID=2172099 RepID=A0A2S0VSQ6_9ALTE|nr:XTP/dITP diphosphatase [Saccharobesus litoralis]AWB67212.1 non-canonical purine NTP pyrophosphatase [Saccharobesus litoralis]
MQKIVLATGNQGKVKELSAMLEPLSIDVVAQSEFNVSSVAETGTTFVENAIIKARHAAAATGLPAIADDSGIEVDYLKGAPGIYSARYSGDNATDEKNNQKLLAELQGVQPEQRTARFQCVLVFMRHKDDPTPIICQGSWQGRITEQRSGSNGFGYDPLFWLDSHHCTSADLSKAEKNKISHRGQALTQLLDKLQSQV